MSIFATGPKTKSTVALYNRCILDCSLDQVLNYVTSNILCLLWNTLETASTKVTIGITTLRLLGLWGIMCWQDLICDSPIFISCRHCWFDVSQWSNSFSFQPSLCLWRANKGSKIPTAWRHTLQCLSTKFIAFSVPYEALQISLIRLLPI